MAEPAATATTIVITGSGLVIVGLTTGLHPLLLVAGAAGALWAQFYIGELPIFQRVSLIIIGALVSAWGAPPLVWALPELPGWPRGIPVDGMMVPLAITIGLLFHTAGGVAVRWLSGFKRPLENR